MKCAGFGVEAEAEGQSSGSCTIALGFQPLQQVLGGLWREGGREASQMQNLDWIWAHCKGLSPYLGFGGIRLLKKFYKSDLNKTWTVSFHVNQSGGQDALSALLEEWKSQSICLPSVRLTPQSAALSLRNLTVQSQFHGKVPGFKPSYPAVVPSYLYHLPPAPPSLPACSSGFSACYNWYTQKEHGKITDCGYYLFSAWALLSPTCISTYGWINNDLISQLP